MKGSRVVRSCDEITDRMDDSTCATVALWRMAEEFVSNGAIGAAVKCLDVARSQPGITFLLKARTLFRLASLFLEYVVPLEPNSSSPMITAKSLTDQALLMMKGVSGHADFVLSLHAQRVSEYAALREVPGHTAMLFSALSTACEFAAKGKRVRWFLHFVSFHVRLVAEENPQKALELVNESISASQWNSVVVQLWFHTTKLELSMRVGDGLCEEAFRTISSECEGLFSKLQDEECPLSDDIVLIRMHFSLLTTYYYFFTGLMERSSDSLDSLLRWLDLSRSEASSAVDLSFSIHSMFVYELSTYLLGALIRFNASPVYVARGLDLLDSPLSFKVGDDIRFIFEQFRFLFVQVRAYEELTSDLSACGRSLRELRHMTGQRPTDIESCVSVGLLDALLDHAMGNTVKAATKVRSLVASENLPKKLTLHLSLHLLLFLLSIDDAWSRKEASDLLAALSLDGADPSEIAIAHLIRSHFVGGDRGAQELRDALRIARDPLKNKQLIGAVLLETAKVVGDPTMKRDLLTSAYKLARHTHDRFLQMATARYLVDSFSLLNDRTGEADMSAKYTQTTQRHLSDISSVHLEKYRS